MKYNLVGVNGNAFSIMAYVRKAMKDEKFTKDEIEEYVNKATSGDYSNLLATSYAMVMICNHRAENSEDYDDDEEECEEQIITAYLLRKFSSLFNKGKGENDEEHIEKIIQGIENTDQNSLSESWAS